MVEDQKRWLASLLVLEERVTALPHDVPEEDRALAGVHPVAPGGLPVGEPRVGHGPRDRADRPRHALGAIRTRPDLRHPVLPELDGPAHRIGRPAGRASRLPRRPDGLHPVLPPLGRRPEEVGGGPASGEMLVGVSAHGPVPFEEYLARRNFLSQVRRDRKIRPSA